MATHNKEYLTRVMVLLTLPMIMLSTIFRGSNRQVPLVALEWLGLSVLVGWGLHNLFHNGKSTGHSLGAGKRRWALLGLITLPAWVAMLQLTPFPSGAGWRSLSELPETTWASALAGLPVASLFLSALVLETRALKLLIRLWIAVAVLQGLLGLMQIGGFEFLYFGSSYNHGVMGTFGNRNHFALFMAMTIPLALLSLKPVQSGAQRGGAVSWPAIAMLFVLVAALFASLSRTGLVVGLMAAIATSWWLWRPSNKQAGQQSYSWMRALIPLLAVLALAVGGLDWLSRFDSTQLEAAAQVREINRLSAWAAAQAYWPMGSGLGTFRSVFAEYQAPEIRFLVDYAHNDYVQWLLELGVVFVVIAAIVVALVWQRTAQMIRGGGRGSEQDRLALVSAMGLLAVALHAWVDFPLRIPANAMLAAFLLGLFLRAPTDSRGLRRPSAGSKRAESGARTFNF